MAYPNTIAGMATTYQTIQEGNGAAVAAGNTVVVHATGIVGETGKKFWSTKDPGADRVSVPSPWLSD
jgi:FKBP-type peptidyl-prolyl cis-trans isomerase